MIGSALHEWPCRNSLLEGGQFVAGFEIVEALMILNACISFVFAIRGGWKPSSWSSSRLVSSGLFFCCPVARVPKIHGTANNGRRLAPSCGWEHPWKVTSGRQMATKRDPAHPPFRPLETLAARKVASLHSTLTYDINQVLHHQTSEIIPQHNRTRNNRFHLRAMSFEALQERLTALQETTSQVRELIDRLAQLDFQPGSAPLLDDRNNNDDEENVAAELAAEINQILREEEEDLELLAEEVTDLRGGRDGSEATRRKERLRDGVARLDGQVKR